MERSLLVRIFVPTRDERGRDGHGEVGVTGTGYPVGPDLVLTARHVIAPPDRDRNYPIEVLWYYHPEAGPDEGWYKLLKGDVCVVWRSAGNLDAALLRCPRPSRVRGYGFVSREQPRDSEWSSMGFPRASKTAKERAPASFGGSMFAMAREADHFELDNRVPLSAAEDWRGASGMPICPENSPYILGVAKEVPQNFGNQRLHATPAWKLLDDPQFRKFLGFDDQQRRREQFERRLVQVLRQSPRAITAIIDESGLTDIPAGSEPDTIASRLIECDLTEALRGLGSAYDAIETERADGGTTELKEAAETIAKAAQLVAPCLYDEGAINAIGALRNDPDTAIVAVRCYFPTVAEIIMAGYDNRATDYLPRQSDVHHPEGKRLLAAPPEAGIAGLTAQRAAINDALIRKFSPGTWSKLRTQISDYMYRRFIDPSSAVEEKGKQRIREVAAELAVQSSRHSYYLLYRLPDDEEARREMEEGLREIKRDYPSLVILGLSRDPEAAIRERSEFGPFRLMLPLRS